MQLYGDVFRRKTLTPRPGGIGREYRAKCVSIWNVVNVIYKDKYHLYFSVGAVIVGNGLILLFVLETSCYSSVILNLSVVLLFCESFFYKCRTREGIFTTRVN